VSDYNLPFTLTAAGIDAAFDLGAINLDVTHVQIGDGNKTPNGTEVALVSPQESAVISGHFEVAAGQHRIAAVIVGSASSYNISEIGLWSGAPGDVGSVLVFYWALATGHVAVKSASIDFNFENDMLFGGVVPENITIVADTEFNALAMLALHEAEDDPHAQYHLKTTVATETVKGIAEIATQAETESGTDDGRIVTPKKLLFGFEISITQNGYIIAPKWFGSWIFQWGVYSLTDSIANYNYTIPFTTTAAITFGTDYGTAAFHQVSVENVSLSQFKAVSNGTPAGAAVFAIGK
jgi:hypothetical protein